MYSQIIVHDLYARDSWMVQTLRVYLNINYFFCRLVGTQRGNLLTSFVRKHGDFAFTFPSDSKNPMPSKRNGTSSNKRSSKAKKPKESSSKRIHDMRLFIFTYHQSLDPKPRACSRCKTRKIKCEFITKAGACHNCTLNGHECDSLAMPKRVATRRRPRSHDMQLESIEEAQNESEEDQITSVAKVLVDGDVGAADEDENSITDKEVYKEDLESEEISDSSGGEAPVAHLSKLSHTKDKPRSVLQELSSKPGVQARGVAAGSSTKDDPETCSEYCISAILYNSAQRTIKSLALIQH
jgi:hypothetical protein